MRSLLVSSYTPAPVSGRGVRTCSLIRALGALGPVDVVYVPFGAPAPADLGAGLHAVRSTRGPRRLAAAARALAAGAPPGVARGVSPDLGRAAARLAAGSERVVADDPMAAVALLPLARRRPVVYSAHNLESAFRTDWGRRAAAFERRLLERFAETWMPSAADVAGARALAPGATVRLVPNAVDVAAIAPAPRGASRRALMVADFTYAPNREGFAFLRREVLPHAWRAAPDLRVDVAGRGLEPVDDERIRVHGFVDDLAPLYAGAACAVVPLLRGGGSPLKFVEALAYGVPVVATPAAAAGLGARAGEHYLEGADGPAFAAALVRALDGVPEVAAAGRAYAEREHSIEALAARLA